MAELASRISRNLSIPFTIGGGISSLEDVRVLLESGADKISINSASLRNPRLIDDLAKNFGSQFVVLAIDAREEENGWTVFLNGGRLPTERKLHDWAKEGQERGAGEILFTSMDHDGTKNGFANQALSELSTQLSIPIIASGGAGELDHFRSVFKEGKADAALAASVFHFGQIKIRELKNYLQLHQIPIRI
jgi:cyclase